MMEDDIKWDALMASVVKALTMNGNVIGACLDGELCFTPTTKSQFSINYIKKNTNLLKKKL